MRVQWIFYGKVRWEWGEGALSCLPTEMLVKKKTELKSLFQLYFNQLLWFWSHDPAVNSVDELLHADLCGRNFTFDGVLLLSSKTTTPMLLVTSINPHIKTITPSDDVRDTQRHTQLALGS